MIISLAIFAILAILIIWFLFAAIAKGLDNKYYDSDRELFNNKEFIEYDKSDFQTDGCSVKENSGDSESH